MSNKRINYFNLVKILLYLIPIIWLTTIIISILESITYEGFILKHIFINPIILYIIFGTSQLFGLLNHNNKRNSIYIFYQKINLYLSGCLLFFYVILNFLESVTYDNFVYAHFHVNQVNLLIPVILTMFTNLINMGDQIYKVTIKIISRFSIIFPRAVIVIVFGSVLISNAVIIWQDNKENINYIFHNLNASYKQKMEHKVGKQFYDYVMFVKENTPENSKILLPPFPTYPWPQTGNGAYMRYFLYPRVLLNGDEYSSKYDLYRENVDYVLIAWGETLATSNGYTHGWPKFDVKSDNIIFMYKENDYKNVHMNYIYKNVQNQELWGIIKVKK